MYYECLILCSVSEKFWEINKHCASLPWTSYLLTLLLNGKIKRSVSWSLQKVTSHSSLLWKKKIEIIPTILNGLDFMCFPVLQIVLHNNRMKHLYTTLMSLHKQCLLSLPRSLLMRMDHMSLHVASHWAVRKPLWLDTLWLDLLRKILQHNISTPLLNPLTCSWCHMDVFDTHLC